MIEKIELKPCPFCGKQTAVDSFGDACCEDEDCEMSYRDFSPMVWNRRPIEDAQAARIAELEEILVEILDNAVVNGVYREKAEKILKKARGEE